MTRFESKHVTVNRSSEEVFNYLNDLNNFEALLPKEKIADFKGSTDECSFKVQGATNIGLEKVSTNPHSHLQLKTKQGAAIKFTLDIHLEEKDGKVDAYQICNADINPFLKLMLEKPLANLFDYIADKLAENLN